MERESFEDEQVANLLNQSYVAIKVDREERPDIDHIYMTTCQALTGQGGWPLTIVMTPDGKPFFSGTYFPKQSQYGRPGLMDILTQLADKWANEHDRIMEASEKILAHIQPQFAGDKAIMTPEHWIRSAYEGLAATFDPQYGGFGKAPKFPTPQHLLFLLRYSRQTGDKHAVKMVQVTLDRMRRGGIYDHVGGGFARYSTDEKWLVPHFEKMLYDNALLALTYLEAYQVTGNLSYRETVDDIFTYVLRDMRDPLGGFYCAEDADSEGVEGKFYVWRDDDVKAALGETDAKPYCAIYDITKKGNFEGFNIPNLIQTEVSQLENIAGQNWKTILSSWNQKLFLTRASRIHPYKDDKILTAWNGLMIVALAKAGAVLQNKRYIEAAKQAFQFILSKLMDNSGRLLARFRDNEAKYLAYADDYAYIIWGLIELYEATYEPVYLRHAVSLQDRMMQLFWDEKEDGFFLYGADSETLIARPKQIYDGATPSANSVGAYNLLRLAHITGKHEYADYGSRVLEAFAGIVTQYPLGYTFYLLAAQFATGGTKEIVIAGQRESKETRLALQSLVEKYLPECIVVFHPSGEDAREIESAIPYICGQGMVEDRTTVYICENFACQKPRNDVQSAIASL